MSYVECRPMQLFGKYIRCHLAIHPLVFWKHYFNFKWFAFQNHKLWHRVVLTLIINSVDIRNLHKWLTWQRPFHSDMKGWDPGWCSSVDGALVCRLKSCRCPATNRCFSPSLCPSYPLSLQINKRNLYKNERVIIILISRGIVRFKLTYIKLITGYDRLLLFCSFFFPSFLQLRLKTS